MNNWYDNLHTTTIPIEFKNGKIYLENGKKLPKIADGARAEIIIPTFYIKDKKVKQEFNKEEIFTLFEKKTKLYVEMNIRNFEPNLKDFYDKTIYFQNKHLVEIELIDDLKIKERGTKFPRLEFCNVKTTKLDINAKSLNEIYSKISLIYENHRMSHTGNSFDKVYFQENENMYKQIKYKKYIKI
ncbi:hypothetical protein [Aliarcobacter cryaerophilus]|uniref:hypothetical protein n=2 Tax=Aliarcobacter cryaerophilus TaxID=28198 RepID=UPI003DA367CE